MPDSAPEEPTDLVPAKNPALSIAVAGHSLQPRTYGELVDYAKMIAGSGMVPKAYERKPGAVLVAMDMGATLGLRPMQAIQSIAVINGMPAVWGDGLLAIVLAHPDCTDVIEMDAEEIRAAGKAVCVMKRKGKADKTRTFTIDMAKKAGLWGKSGPWTNYPERMMQMRARSWAARDQWADVLRGVRVAEETMDIDMGPAEFVDDDGGPIEGVHSVHRAAAPAPETAPAENTPETTAAELRADHSAAQEPTTTAPGGVNF